MLTMLSLNSLTMTHKFNAHSTLTILNSIFFPCGIYFGSSRDIQQTNNTPTKKDRAEWSDDEQNEKKTTKSNFCSQTKQ